MCLPFGENFVIHLKRFCITHTAAFHLEAEKQPKFSYHSIAYLGDKHKFKLHLFFLLLFVVYLCQNIAKFVPT